MGENLDLVREGLDAWRRGDVGRALEFAHPEIVCRRVPPLPDPQTYHGTEGLLQMYADWSADFEEFEMEPLEYVEIGDWVLVDMIQRGTGRASGATVVGRFWMAYEISAGKAIRQDAYLTKQQALEAASPPA